MVHAALGVVASSKRVGGGTPVVETFDTPGADTWQAPAGVTSVIAEVWGEGGFGGSGETSSGGGGGAYSKKTIAVTPSNNYNYLVGQSGFGEGSWFVDASTVYADYGSDALGSSQGQGGTTGDSIGDTKFSGGDGGTIGTTGGGGGGSSGGSAANGNVGSNGSTVNGGAGGVAVADGGAGGNGGNFDQDGSNGVQPGGGGGGQGNLGATGGSGGNGRVRLSYTLP